MRLFDLDALVAHYPYAIIAEIDGDSMTVTLYSKREEMPTPERSGDRAVFKPLDPGGGIDDPLQYRSFRSR